jgi:hypothetical protein
MQALGGMMSAWELWEKAMVPSLLSGAGTWTQITEKEVDMCDKLQDMFWRIMLEVPESCPRIALRAETRMISMKYRIWQQKLLLLKRIRGQSQTTLSRKILDEQKDNDWPGLSTEVRDICEELGIPDLNVNEMTANHIKTAVIDHHDRNMMEEIAKSKKMMMHKNNDFSQVQNYLKGKSLDNCRMAFRIRCELVKNIKCNFKDKYRRRGGEDAWICDECESNEVQTQSHCLLCPRWEGIRSGLKLDDMEGLVTFFQRLLMERARSNTGSV